MDHSQCLVFRVRVVLDADVQHRRGEDQTSHRQAPRRQEDVHVSVALL